MSIMNTAQQTRLAARHGILTTQTSSLAPGHVQANLLVLPSSVAGDFELLCLRNPMSCPLLGRSKYPGNPREFVPGNLVADDRVIKPGSNNVESTSVDGASDSVKGVAGDGVSIDIRTDLPQYTIYRAGKLIATKPDILSEWQPDSVAFLIGCSFTFDNALCLSPSSPPSPPLTPRHISQQCNVPMYISTTPLFPAGIFTGSKMVVSMRPYPPEHMEKVRDITRPYQRTHGEPVAWGWDGMRALGIKDLGMVDFGDSVRMEVGEEPVFWGCGVTPQVAVMAAGDKIPGLVMGHKPGHMLVLDITEDELFASDTSWK